MRGLLGRLRRVLLLRSSLIDAERAAAFVLERVQAARGRLWDEGAAPSGRTRAGDPSPSSPALTVFARRRVRGVAEPVCRGLLAWARGERPVDLLDAVPAARAVLDRQARGRRFVSLVDDAAALAHGDPRHPDGLSFALHDLCHLEKFMAPDDHQGQVGFFRAVAGALDDPRFAALEASFDETWRADRDYVIADMNGSAVFLFASLKMKLNMAVRRRLARAAGRPAPTTGPLDAVERAALVPALDTLFDALALPAELRAAAHTTSARRDHPGSALLLLEYFQTRGVAAENHLG